MHRLLVIAGAIVLSVGGGVWLAHSLALALPLRGVLVGLALGVLIAFVLVHDFSRGRQVRPVRVTRRR
jgi:hypothetical protein